MKRGGEFRFYQYLVNTQMGSRKGNTLISALIAGTILLVPMVFAISSQKKSQSSQNQFRQTFVSRLYATELLETFRSYDTSTQLLNYLKATWGTQNFCTKFNLLDRSTGTIANAVNLANLPSSILSNSDPKIDGNRYFQFSVVDTATKEVKSSPYCSQLISSIGALGPSERIAVTVGISWVSTDTDASNPRSLELTTLVPGA